MTRVIAVDLAAVHLGAVVFGRAYVDTAVCNEYVSEVPSSMKGIKRDFKLADALQAFIQANVDGNTLLAFEDTRFGPATFANVGNLRGMLADRHRSGHFGTAELVFVSPSRWRAFHGLAGKRTEPLAKVYANRTSDLGYAPGMYLEKKPTARNTQDLNAAYLMGLLACQVWCMKNGQGYGPLTSDQLRFCRAILTDSDLWIPTL